MGEITTISLDLAKNVFQVHAVDEAGKVQGGGAKAVTTRPSPHVFCRDCAVPGRPVNATAKMHQFGHSHTQAITSGVRLESAHVNTGNRETSLR